MTTVLCSNLKQRKHVNKINIWCDPPFSQTTCVQLIVLVEKEADDLRFPPGSVFTFTPQFPPPTHYRNVSDSGIVLGKAPERTIRRWEYERIRDAPEKPTNHSLCPPVTQRGPWQRCHAGWGCKTKTGAPSGNPAKGSKIHINTEEPADSIYSAFHHVLHLRVHVWVSKYLHLYNNNIHVIIYYILKTYCCYVMVSVETDSIVRLFPGMCGDAVSVILPSFHRGSVPLFKHPLL